MLPDSGGAEPAVRVAGPPARGHRRPRRADSRAIEIAPELSSDGAAFGPAGARRAPYLRNLAALVLLGTAGAALMDYMFKAQAVASFGRGDSAAALLRDLLRRHQPDHVRHPDVARAGSRSRSSAWRSARARPRWRCSPAASARIAGTGLASAIVARGGESVFRGSLFRSGYEIFYTPIPPNEKRAAKSLIDVGFDRLGDAVGGGLVRPDRCCSRRASIRPPFCWWPPPARRRRSSSPAA